MAERYGRIDFRDPHTMAAAARRCRCRAQGVNHVDFSADGRYFIASCEFAGELIKVDLARARGRRHGCALDAGAMPQDVKLAPDGSVFYVADMVRRRRLEVIDAETVRISASSRPAAGAHGLYPSRDAKDLYVSNRDEGTRLGDRASRPGKVRDDVDDPRRRQPRHGRRVGRRHGAVAVRPLRQRGLRAVDTATGSCSPGSRSARARTGSRLAAARPLLARPHRRHALSPTPSGRSARAQRLGRTSIPGEPQRAQAQQGAHRQPR